MGLYMTATMWTFGTRGCPAKRRVIHSALRTHDQSLVNMVAHVSWFAASLGSSGSSLANPPHQVITCLLDDDDGLSQRLDVRRKKNDFKPLS